MSLDLPPVYEPTNEENLTESESVKSIQETILMEQYGGEESDVFDALEDFYLSEGNNSDSFYDLQQRILGGLYDDESVGNKEATLNKLSVLTYEEFQVDMKLITGGRKTPSNDDISKSEGIDKNNSGLNTKNLLQELQAEAETESGIETESETETESEKIEVLDLEEIAETLADYKLIKVNNIEGEYLYEAPDTEEGIIAEQKEREDQKPSSGRNTYESENGLMRVYFELTKKEDGTMELYDDIIKVTETDKNIIHNISASRLGMTLHDAIYGR